MLERLKINNLAVVGDVEVSFSNGMNVITGETGTGKSLLITAIKLLLGGRADKSMIRTGEKSSIIYAEFFFDKCDLINSILIENGLKSCEEKKLILRRIISENTSRNLVNDEPVTLQFLKILGSVMVDMHGPYDHQSLLDTQKQLEILDEFGNLNNYSNNYGILYQEYKDLVDKLNDLESQQIDIKDHQVDFLKHKINEVETAGLSIQEEQEVINEHDAFSNFQKILELSNNINNLLDEDEMSANSRLISAKQLLNKLNQFLPESLNWSRDIDQVSDIINETVNAIKNYVQSVDCRPERMQWLDDRLTTYQNIKRKYGCNVEELSIKLDQWKLELNELKERDDIIKNYKIKKSTLYKKVLDCGLKLRRKREIASKKLSDKITNELSEIGFDCGVFSISMLNIDPYKKGIDAIEFGFSPNVGEEIRDLKSIASSGEISRVMLAIKAVLANQDNIPILIFDEIDSNIGGEIGTAVGKKLSKVSNNHQVLCITHLPQVAVYGTCHLAVTKEVKSGRTFTEVTLLDKEERVNEIARMLGGYDKDGASLKHAEVMLKK